MAISRTCSQSGWGGRRGCDGHVIEGSRAQGVGRMAGNSEAYEHVGGHGDVSSPNLNEVHAIAGYGGGERVPISHYSDPPGGRDRRTHHVYAAAGGGGSSLEVRTVGWRQQGQRAGRVGGQGFPEHHACALTLLTPTNGS